MVVAWGFIIFLKILKIINLRISKLRELIPKYFIFDSFFECLLNKNLKECEYYKKFDESAFSTNEKKSDIKEFKYGVDETFTMIIKEYLYKNKYRLFAEMDFQKAIFNINKNSSFCFLVGMKWCKELEKYYKKLNQTRKLR